ncbi:MAG: hypothetical protein U0R70_04345 [Solirubrobacteraceae bacterium]
MAAAALSVAGGLEVLAVAIVVVIALNAVFAFAQELQAERATEALREFPPPQARVRRDGAAADIDALRARARRRAAARRGRPPVSTAA